MLMELGLGNGVATIVSLVDGSTSMYLSSGGGIIGGGGHEHVRNAASRFVLKGEEFLPRFLATGTFPLPDPEQVLFYALTYEGGFVAQASNEELMAERSELTPLFGAGQDVISALRTIPNETVSR